MNEQQPGANPLPGQTFIPVGTASAPSPTPATTSVPPPPVVPGTTPTSAPATPSSTGIDDNSFLGLLNNLNSGFQTNNGLVDQKNAVMHALMGNPIDPAVMQKLPSDIQGIIQGGNRDQLLLQAQILNDSITGKNASLASSIGFLTTGWQDSQKRKDTETANLLNYSRYYGIAPVKLVKALYPDLLKTMSPEQLKDLEALPAPYTPNNYNAPVDPSTVPGTLPTSDPVSLATSAIVGIESGGNYQAVSPAIVGGEYAGHQSYGKYQVLDVHIPDWTQQAIGKSMTPQEFLADPAAQDAVAKMQIGNLWNQYGNIADVASVWFTGLPAAQSAGRVDQATGMSSETYIQNATDAFNKASIAALSPSGDSSNAITSVTGLDGLTFAYATQGSNALSRQPTTIRNKTIKAWTDYANAAGVDLSTFQAQYKGYNDTLTSNISRFNNTQVAEGEVTKTLDNLDEQSITSGLGSVNLINVGDILAGQQVNDPSANAYAFYFQDLKNSLSYFYAAQQGKTSPDVNDNKDAADVIVAGLSSGGISGLKDATQKTTEKMKVVLGEAVDNARHQVWDLFGVGDKFKPKTKSDTSSSSSSSTDLSSMSDADLQRIANGG